METANSRLDELVAFGAGLFSPAPSLNLLGSNDVIETTNNRFSRGQIDHSRFLIEHVETGNPQGAAEWAGIDREADFLLQVVSI
jgi:hypothetical protein